MIARIFLIKLYVANILGVFVTYSRIQNEYMKNGAKLVLVLFVVDLHYWILLIM